MKLAIEPPGGAPQAVGTPTFARIFVCLCDLLTKKRHDPADIRKIHVTRQCYTHSPKPYAKTFFCFCRKSDPQKTTMSRGFFLMFLIALFIYYN